MTTTTTTEVHVSATETPPSRFTGHCACCGLPGTKSLFQMGHDAKFKSLLTAALKAGTPVRWFTAERAYDELDVQAALDRVDTLLHRDWREKVERSASRGVTRRAPSADGTRSSVLTSDFSPRDFAAEKIDSLMDRLAGQPRTGDWGWWRPSGPAGRGVRFPARVQKTRRDSGDSRVDLFCPEAFKAGVIASTVTELVRPSEFVRDPDARNA